MVVRVEAKAAGSLADAARGRVAASALRSDLGDLSAHTCDKCHSPKGLSSGTVSGVSKRRRSDGSELPRRGR